MPRVAARAYREFRDERAAFADFFKERAVRRRIGDVYARAHHGECRSAGFGAGRLRFAVHAEGSAADERHAVARAGFAYRARGVFAVNARAARADHRDAFVRSVQPSAHVEDERRVAQVEQPRGVILVVYGNYARPELRGALRFVFRPRARFSLAYARELLFGEGRRSGVDF